MLDLLKKNSILIDAGKGTISKEAIREANTRKINIFRIDIFPSLEGLISKTFSIEKQIKKIQKRKIINGINILNSGQLGNYGDIIVDDIDSINRVYGVCDGKGDFLRKIPSNYKKILNKLTK